MNEKAIEVKKLNYKFGSTTVLNDINFSVDKGKIVVIIGPNGSGKTTLLKNIIGIYRPFSGEILIDGQAPKNIVKKIGYVPQKFEFARDIPVTVREFMDLEKCGEKNHGCGNISKMLYEVGLENFEDRGLSDLSGGQFQRVMIARALLHEKEFLIFDEPAAGIDIAGGQTIYDLIKKINQQIHATCLIVSHELNIVNKYANKVICLNKKIICTGAPEIAITPENLKRLYGADASLYHHH